MTINIINEYAVNDNDDDNNGRISLQSVAMTIASELNNKCEIVPGKNRWGNQPSFLIIPNDLTQYYKIRIWSMTDPRTGEPYPTYNTMLYGDGFAQHTERAVPCTYASAIKTAKLMPKANKAMKVTKISDKSDNKDDKLSETSDDMKKFAANFRKAINDKLSKYHTDTAIAKAQGKFKWDVGDVVYSERTGKTYNIIGLLVRKNVPMYLYNRSTDQEQGMFYADKAHASLKKISGDDSVSEDKEHNMEKIREIAQKMYKQYNGLSYGPYARASDHAMSYDSNDRRYKYWSKVADEIQKLDRAAVANDDLTETSNINEALTDMDEVRRAVLDCIKYADQFWASRLVRIDYSTPGEYIQDRMRKHNLLIKKRPSIIKKRAIIAKRCADLADKYANDTGILKKSYKSPGNYIRAWAQENNLIHPMDIEESKKLSESTGLKPETIKRYLEVARKQRNELKKHAAGTTEYRGIAKRMMDRREAGIEKAEKRLSDLENRNINQELNENLRAWFGKGKEGGAGGGGWDRYNTKGERIGKCGERKPGEGKPKCLSKQKAAQLRAKGGKKAIAAAVNKKRREDPNPTRRGSAKMVSNKTRSKKTNESLQESWKSIGFDLRSDVLWPALLFESVNPQQASDFKSWINQQRDAQKEPAIGSKCILAMLNHVGDVIMVFYGDAIYAGQSEEHYFLKASSGTHEYSKLNQLVFASEQDFEQFMLLLQMKFQDQQIKIETKKLTVLETKSKSAEQLDELKCWPGYTRVKGVPAGAPGSCKKKTSEGMTEGSGQEPGWFEIYNLRTMQTVHHPFEADNIMDAEVKADDWLEAIGKSGRGLGVRPVKEQDMTEEKCPHCSGPLVEFSQLNEKKDACYYKVKSRYKVWPSAYASGALVKCRKVGAKNWGNKSKTNESNDRERLWILYADDTAVAKYVSEKEAERALDDLSHKYSNVKFKIVHQTEDDAIASNAKSIGRKNANR